MSTEFVKQTLRDNLARTIIPHVADGLWSIYDNALKACQRNGQPEKTLQTFQNLLTRVPQWSEETLTKEVDRIAVASKCDYLEDLLLGVFVSYIRAFASLQQADATHVNLEFERPSLAKFVQAFYNLAARKSWTNAFFFKTIGVSSEQQARNRREIETMLEGAMNEVIDSFIPWRAVSQAYFRAKDEASAPAPAPAPAPAVPPVTFGAPEVHEFETDNEETSEEESESDEEERPRVQLGEEIQLDADDIAGDKDSVTTEDEIMGRAETVGVVALKL
jgi:hypothetical protein